MAYKYKNYIFDLYGTLVDIHTDEEQQELWVKMAQKLSEEYGADYTGADLREKYLLACKEEFCKKQKYFSISTSLVLDSLLQRSQQ